MSSMFQGANSFNGDISTWNVSQCTSFQYMFYQNTAFNQSLVGWTLPTTSTYTMYAMFQQATSFNGDISTWNVSQCTSFQYMFYNNTAFNQSLVGWTLPTASSYTMSSMFQGANSFNGDISTWNVSQCTNFTYMFYNNTAFNQSLVGWTLPHHFPPIVCMVCSREPVSMATFQPGTLVNAQISILCSNERPRSISPWSDGPLPTTSTYTMYAMFRQANIFNGDISTWNVSKCTNFTYMFYQEHRVQSVPWSDGPSPPLPPILCMVCSGKPVSMATFHPGTLVKAQISVICSIRTPRFNQNITYWDTSSVTSYTNMFNGATLMIC